MTINLSLLHQWEECLCIQAGTLMSWPIRGFLFKSAQKKKYYLAKKLTDEEKDEMWPTICSFYPGYDQYKKNTQRNIGVFSCEEKAMTKEWKEWISENINRGCDKNELYSILYHDGVPS